MNKHKVVVASALLVICMTSLAAQLSGQQRASLSQGERTDLQLPAYHINSFDHYFVCFNAQGRLLWRMRKSRVGRYGMLVWCDGYLIVVDGRHYKVLSIPTGDVLYEKTLRISPNGLLLQDYTLKLNEGGKIQTFPVFPRGFRRKYGEHRVPKGDCSTKRFLVARAPRPPQAETENHVLDFGPFLAAFDGLGRERWRRSLKRPCHLEAAHEQILIARDRKVLSVDAHEGDLAWEVDLPDTVVKLVADKLVFAILDNGDTIWLQRQVGEWASSKWKEREAQQKGGADQPSGR